MRKLILSLVFVLATGSTFMNANNSSTEIVKKSYCDEVYTETRDSVTAATGSEYIGISAAIAAENACMDEMEIE
jgi:hypothetical protein